MKNDRLKLIAAMVIFGTIGLLRRSIPCASAVVALVRGVVGTAFLLLWRTFRGRRFHWAVLKDNALLLFLSGALIGINWVCLFEAYNYTAVSVATVCYYMAPIFVILASPLVLREKLTLRKGICAAVAFGGMVLSSGIGSDGGAAWRGIGLALAAAAMYASVILLNKRIEGMEAEERTAVQLFAAALVLLPYVLLKTGLPTVAELSGQAILLLLVAGILHTGVAYTLYFGSLGGVSAQSAALLSYMDPVVALLLSALVLQEKLSLLAWVGAGLVIAAAVASELGESAD